MHMQIGFSGLPLRIIPVLTSVVTMTMASFVYLPVVVNGGVGKNGSTIAVSLLDIIVKTAFHVSCLQCFDAVGWAAGRASGL